MTVWRRWLVCGLVPLALGVWVGGCNRRGDTQTNWLKTCDSNDDCGDFVCVCGVCTFECSQEPDCASAPAGVTCMPSSSPAVQALCGANASASVCLYECSRDSECAKGQRCTDHACVPSGDGQGQAGGSGTGTEPGGASGQAAGSSAGGDSTATANAGDANSGATTSSNAGATSSSIGGAGGTSSVEPVPAGAGGQASGENTGGFANAGAASKQSGPGLVDRGGKSTALASDGVAVADMEACPGEVQGEWTAMTQTGAPTPAADPYLYWDGQELLVFYFSQVYGLYDPCQDAWRTVSTSPNYLSPTAAIEADARLWFFRSIYDPSTEGLSPELSGLNPTSGAFEVRSVAGATMAGYTANVSTGTELMVWGGAVARGSTNNGYDGTNAGSIYSPADDRWQTMTQQGAPAPRIAPAAWTGTELVVWGGHSADTVPTDGGRSDCALSNAPQCVEYNDGALYDPALDRWRPMAQAGAPQARRDHIVTWTGNRVLVWGGRTIDTRGRSRPGETGGEAAAASPRSPSERGETGSIRRRWQWHDGCTRPTSPMHGTLISVVPKFAAAVSFRYPVQTSPEAWVLPEGTVPESVPHDAAAERIKSVLVAWTRRSPRNVWVARNLAIRWIPAQPSIGIDPDVCVLEPPPDAVGQLSSLCLRNWKTGSAGAADRWRHRTEGPSPGAAAPGRRDPGTRRRGRACRAVHWAQGRGSRPRTTGSGLHRA